MAFTKKHIPAKTFALIDIGSYKIRVCAAQFKNRKITILGYHEKRQDVSYFSNSECVNIPGLCSNISDSLGFIENKIGFSLPKLIINYPFGDFFIQNKSIHYKRKDADKKLSSSEFEEILYTLEKLNVPRHFQSISEDFGYDVHQLHILLSRVSKIYIDGKVPENILGSTGEKVSVSILNGAIPKENHALITHIWNALWRNIYKVLPSECSIAHMFQVPDVLIINIGASQTSLSFKKKWELKAVSKVPIWIQKLIEKISQEHKISKISVLDTLESPKYSKERDFFLSVWGESFWIVLSDLLGKHICPKKIFIGGGASNNTFIKAYIQNFDFWSYGVQAPSQIDFISEDLSPALSLMENISVDMVGKINLDMYGLIMETQHILWREHDRISSSLKSAMKRLWYSS